MAERSETAPPLTYEQAVARYHHAPADPDVHRALFAEIGRLREVAREHADRADNLRSVLDGIGESVSHAE